MAYKTKEWVKSRRAIVVRRPKKVEGAKDEILFKEELLRTAYDNTVNSTTTDLPVSKVHGLYDQRGECENRIEELKCDHGLDGFAIKGIGGTEAAFRFILLAQNIMALFKQKVLTGPVKHQLATIRFQCIAIGSYLVSNGRKIILNLSSEGERMRFLEHFFDQVEFLKPQFRFSTA